MREGPQVYSVGAVVTGVRRLLEDRVGRIWIAGEISNLRRPASGHCYFTLKDDVGQLRAALFRSAARGLAFEPEDGLEVMAYGEVTVYEARGELQLVVRALEPRGRGALQLAFEQLWRRLEGEGLFAEERKRPLPAVPGRVGIVTSRSGAALRDVLEVARQRYPGLPLRLADAPVQGREAEAELARALADLAARGDVDLILLVRGGGSLEDLQAFNGESLARAIVACPVPVLTGVGHEIDTTIADAVADARAPTPSAAAERAIPDRRALAGQLDARRRRLDHALRTRLDRERIAWSHASSRLRSAAPGRRVADGHGRLEAAGRDLARALREVLDRAASRAGRTAAALAAGSPERRLPRERERWLAARRALQSAARADLAGRRTRLGQRMAALDSLSPLAVLDRGYGLVRRAGDGAIVRELGEAPPGEVLDVSVARAELRVVVESGSAVERRRPR